MEEQVVLILYQGNGLVLTESQSKSLKLTGTNMAELLAKLETSKCSKSLPQTLSSPSLVDLAHRTWLKPDRKGKFPFSS
jgi:hypothetical protein